MDYELEDASVLVTGAASGIGLGIARAFAAQGARLALVDRDEARLRESAAMLPRGNRNILLACDLRSDDAVAAMREEIATGFGSLDVLVNNAGMEYPTPLADDAPDAMQRWSALLDNNVATMARTTRALLPLLGNGASIINQASIWGHTGIADFSAYVASKHAVIGFTRALAHELGRRGIRVNAVCPGWIRTEASLASLRAMSAAAGRRHDEMLEEILAAQVFRRLLEPEDIADVYLFLASPGSRTLTGQSIIASNGEVMH